MESMQFPELPSNTRLMIVSKKQTPKSILECIEKGAKLFGENRVQEVKEKWESSELKPYRNKVRLHFIGHLQGNKVKEICPLVDAIQSVDSFKLAEKINDECENIKKIMPIFLQVNITGEEQKFGFKPEELPEVLKKIQTLPHVQVIGLMCMARFDAEKAEIKKTFRTCKTLATKFHLKECSMGMSDDYEIAVEEGSTLVRLGRKIFGDVV